MLIQFLIILFSFFALNRLRIKFKSKDISNKEFLLWLSFWFIVIGATIWFRQTDRIASFFGVEKGADLAVYISIIALFYLIFKIIVKLDRLERDLTKLVRDKAINEREPDRSDSQSDSGGKEN